MIWKTVSSAESDYIMTPHININLKLFHSLRRGKTHPNPTMIACPAFFPRETLVLFCLQNRAEHAKTWQLLSYRTRVASNNKNERSWVEQLEPTRNRRDERKKNRWGSSSKAAKRASRQSGVEARHTRSEVTERKEEKQTEGYQTNTEYLSHVASVWYNTQQACAAWHSNWQASTGKDFLYATCRSHVAKIFAQLFSARKKLNPDQLTATRMIDLRTWVHIINLLKKLVGRRLRLDCRQWFTGGYVHRESGVVVAVQDETGVVLPDTTLVRAVYSMRNVQKLTS